MILFWPRSVGKRILRGREESWGGTRGKRSVGKSTLNRLETGGEEVVSTERYKKIIYDAGAIGDFF
jgi:hypothetical protein